MVIVVDTSAWIDFFRLIAVPVIKHGASLLHSDSDVETIAQHTSLKLERLQ